MHIEDRGYQFADGVYEVWAVFGGKLADAEGHFARLERSPGRTAHRHADEQAALTFVLSEAMRRNRSATAWSICRSAAAWRRATTPSRRRRVRRPW